MRASWPPPTTPTTGNPPGAPDAEGSVDERSVDESSEEASSDDEASTGSA